MSHPYSALSEHHFWSKAVSHVAPGRINPVTKSAQIERTDKVATMGSCFAQHLSQNLQKTGCHYFVTEEAPSHMSVKESRLMNYGVFSARYGNIYTTRQAVQLFDRAYSLFVPHEDVWTKGAQFVDPFRPQIQPYGFSSEEELRADRVRHFACVRRIFEESNWLIFTLGLTEAWRSIRDHAVFPMAPGVAGGIYNPEVHEFVNFSADQVINDLKELIQRLGSVNPNLRLLLTVSPVPLVATYEERHVLVSTTASKSILRVAADVIEREYENVIYFPSYEIITSPANSGRYYEDDLRQVTPLGVGHVMRVFDAHFLTGQTEGTSSEKGLEFVRPQSEDNTIVCDEEEIERAVRRLGF